MFQKARVSAPPPVPAAMTAAPAIPPVLAPARGGTATGPRWATVLEIAGVALVLLAFAGYLHACFVPVFTGVDPNGYHVSARLFAQTGWFGFRPPDPYVFVGRMWVENDAGEYFAKYPPLYPALAGALMRWGGPDAGLYVNPVCGWLALAGVYVLARLMGLARWSLLALFIMAFNPVLGLYAVRQVSHASSLAFLVWGYAAFFGCERARRSGARRVLAALAGLAIGYAAGIRYTNVLLAVPPLVLAFRPAWRGRGAERAALLGGLALPWGALAAYHWIAFGGPFTTGYALTGEQPGFSWTYFRENLRFYVTALFADGAGPLAVLALPALLFGGTGRGRRNLLFVLWTLPLFLLYNAYYWAPETRSIGFLRFVLPLFVPLALWAAWTLREATRAAATRTAPAVAIVVLLAGVQGVWGWQRTLENVGPFWRSQALQRKAIDVVRRAVPDGAALFANGALLDFLDQRGKYRLYPDELFNRGRLKALVTRTLEPGPSGLQKERAEWLQREFLDGSGADYRRRLEALLDAQQEAGRPVYFAGPRPAVAGLQAALLARYTFQMVAVERLEIPERPLPSPVKDATALRHRAAAGGEFMVARLLGRREGPAPPEAQVAELLRQRSELAAEIADGSPERRRLLREWTKLNARIRALADRSGRQTAPVPHRRALRDPEHIPAPRVQ